MPLRKGKSKKAFNYNLRELISSGKAKKQALAISLSVKRKGR